VPFFTKVAGALITGGPSAVAARDTELAADARRSMEALGPTYIKVGQARAAGRCAGAAHLARRC
jgi:predicted unusual protein kinase regulating ubiquinone biosynthesis (AarF/ABC1/UbiB family)